MQCFQNSQVERIRARHDGNEQAVEMCKVEMRMVHMLVEMGWFGVGDDRDGGGGEYSGEHAVEMRRVAHMMGVVAAVVIISVR